MTVRKHRIIPWLTTWLKSSENLRLIALAESLLKTLLTDGDADMPDISTYLTALGLPSLLDCSSFASYVEPEEAQYKLHCCADLLGAFLQQPSLMSLLP